MVWQIVFVGHPSRGEIGHRRQTEYVVWLFGVVSEYGLRGYCREERSFDCSRIALKSAIMIV